MTSNRKACAVSMGDSVAWVDCLTGGAERFSFASVFFYSIISLCYVWVVNVSQLTLVRIGQGVAGSMILPIAMAYVGDLSPEGEEGKRMGYSNAASF